MTKISFQDWFEMDDCMKPLIKLLNNKGYETKYCCSGHPKQAIWKYPIAFQEDYFNMKSQYGVKRNHRGYTRLGYIIFTRKKDRDLIFNLLKKTKYAKRFRNYQSFEIKGLSAFEKRWIEGIDKVWIEFAIKGLAQEDIKRIWREVYKGIARKNEKI